MKKQSVKITSFIIAAYNPAFYINHFSEIKHLQNNPLLPKRCNDPDNIILLPLIDAILHFAKNDMQIFCYNDMISLKENFYYNYAKDNTVFVETITHTSPRMFCNSIRLATATAILNDNNCKEGFALVQKKDANLKSVLLLHKYIMDYFIANDFSVCETRFIETLFIDDKDTTILKLSNIVYNVDCTNAEKYLKSIGNNEKSNTFAPITEHFSADAFSQKSSFTLSENLKLDSMYNPICNAFVNDVRSILLYGPAGTGKSISAKLICREVGIPVSAVINCTSNTDEYLLGKYVLKDNKTYFCESAVTQAIRNGGAVIFEEINFAKPNYISFLNSLLDDNGFVLLDNNEYVKRHKNFRFIATMNSGYAGTKQMNEALLNRIDITINVPDMSESMIRKALLDESPDCEKYLDRIIEIYTRIRELVQNGESDCTISVRNLISWVRLAKYEDYRSAAENTIVCSAVNSEETREAYRDLLDLYLW